MAHLLVPKVLSGAIRKIGQGLDGLGAVLELNPNFDRCEYLIFVIILAYDDDSTTSIQCCKV